MSERKSIAPRGPIKLDSLANVRTEMARLYRLALKRDIEADTMTKLIYGLKEIRCCIEGELLSDVQVRLASLTEAKHG